MITTLDFVFVVVIAVVLAIVDFFLLHKGAEQGRRADQAEALAKTYKAELDAFEEYYDSTESFLDDLSENFEDYDKVFENHKDYVTAHTKVAEICFR